MRPTPARKPPDPGALDGMVFALAFAVWRALREIKRQAVADSIPGTTVRRMFG